MYLDDRDGVVPRALLQSMADVQRHRGPDGEGLRQGPGYGFAHRRLAIVDIDGGAQPMSDSTGRVWVTFNGQIYNHEDLRAELEAAGCRFRTRSDTEVLVHGWRRWREELPVRLRGMFAFVVVDEDENCLFAARDRLGQKPLHWLYDRGRFAFASELKALLVEGLAVERRVDPAALAEFLCLRYVPEPKTIYGSIHKLPPAHRLLLRRGAAPRIDRYWRLSFAAPAEASAAELAERTLELLDEATRIRLMGEVPLGAFLSGGVDSFAVVDSMARASSEPVVACTIGFDEADHDERAHARLAASRCGARLYEEVVRVADMEDQGWYADTFDEPFADDSAVPTYHVSRLARRHVTVALAGDGGDEAFAGYRRYRFDVLENRCRRWLPAGLWRALGAVYPKADFLPRILRFKRTLQNLGCDPAVAYARSVSGSLPEEVLPLLRFATDGLEPLQPVVAAYRAADGPDPLSRACATDFATYLPGDILAKVDRASMAHSLEVRGPFLDHRLVELAATVPSALKISGGRTKAFLRRALRPRLGAGIEQRPKQGFSVPLRRWLAKGLGDELERLLHRGPLGDVVDTERVDSLLARHRARVADHAELLWALLVLGRFLGRWRGQVP